MKGKIYSTKEIADLCGIHPNTVRLYEKWGYISKADRGTNNYRRFCDEHLRQMRLARTALPGPYPIDYDIVQGLVKKYAAGDKQGSMKLAGKYLAQVKTEMSKAVAAMKVLDRWFENKPGSKENIVYETRKRVAATLGLTIDALRTWERNGLYTISKNARGKLQFSEWDIEKLMVIRLLRNGGYSIASLLNVFGNEEILIEKPSKLLSLNPAGSEINYITDRYIEYLEGHILRAKKIISLLEKY
ncbi:MAG TPA: MerR family transcriptional regulator [Bacillota bacterium]|nr:MerR family transcriptional regulator [Bacillota bacterium]